MSEIRDKRCTIPPLRDRTLVASVSLLIIHALKYLRISFLYVYIHSFFLSVLHLSLSLSLQRKARERYSLRCVYLSDRPTTKVDVPRARPDSPPLSFPVYEFWCSFSRLSTPMENDPIPVSSRPPDRIVAPEGKNPSVGSPSNRLVPPSPLPILKFVDLSRIEC